MELLKLLFTLGRLLSFPLAHGPKSDPCRPPLSELAVEVECMSGVLPGLFILGSLP